MRCNTRDLGRLVCVGLLAAAIAPIAPAVALADDIFTSEDACRNAEIGKACKFDGGSGTCQEVDCKRMDYSVNPPKPKTERCRDCRPAPPMPAVGKAHDGKASDPQAAPSSTSAPKAGCQVAPDHAFTASLGLGLLALAVVTRRGRP